MKPTYQELEQKIEILEALNSNKIFLDIAGVMFIKLDTNGFEATKLIKEFSPDMPIVAQTAYSTRRERKKAFASGCDEFISKPISDETFAKIVTNFL